MVESSQVHAKYRSSKKQKLKGNLRDRQHRWGADRCFVAKMRNFLHRHGFIIPEKLKNRKLQISKQIGTEVWILDLENVKIKKTHLLEHKVEILEWWLFKNLLFELHVLWSIRHGPKALKIRTPPCSAISSYRCGFSKAKTNKSNARNTQTRTKTIKNNYF